MNGGATFGSLYRYGFLPIRYSNRMPYVHGPKAIYALVDPRDGETRYVGASKHPQRRLIQHVKEEGATVPRIRDWLGGLAAEGLKPKLEVLVEASDDWRVNEARMRHRYRATILNPQPNEGLVIDVRPAVAQALRALRADKGLTREAVAEAVNRTPTTVYRWETGSRTPDVNDLAVLSQVYNVEPSVFLPSKLDIEGQISKAQSFLSGEEPSWQQQPSPEPVAARRSKRSSR